MSLLATPFSTVCAEQSLWRDFRTLEPWTAPSHAGGIADEQAGHFGSDEQEI